MRTHLSAPPALSTPDIHILNDNVTLLPGSDADVSDNDLSVRYEIERTVSEIQQHRWRRVALQFPDEMLPDSPRISHILARKLKRGFEDSASSFKSPPTKDHLVKQGDSLVKQEDSLVKQEDSLVKSIPCHRLDDIEYPPKLTILADTSYGSCCVDEIAAEHVDAEVVVHYGRACLSPTSRLPVIHVFTTRDLALDVVAESFQETFPDLTAKIIIAADVIYTEHICKLTTELRVLGYSNLFATSVIHNPSSPIPNRTVPDMVHHDTESLKEWSLFHISEPPTSLVLTLSSRLAAMHIYPTGRHQNERPSVSLQASSSLLLRRRYALVTSLSTVSIWGILINTLSVKNYLYMVDHIKRHIAAAGKKSYLFVVGKLNAAKVANFSEVGGWVVIGCWESSLIDSTDFYRPVITPFELEIALTRDEQRTWTGAWRGDFQSILDKDAFNQEELSGNMFVHTQGNLSESDGGFTEDHGSEEESVPPEFDLRTGRYVSHTRPMKIRATNEIDVDARRRPLPSSALSRKPESNLVTVNGVSSPAGEFLGSNRTWKGLGSDLEVAYDQEDGSEEGAVLEEGSAGIARGYTVGGSDRR